LERLVSLTTIGERIHRIDSELGTRRLQQWVVTGDDGALLIDTGIAGTVTGAVAPALDELGIGIGGLTDVIITHADVDHYGGDGELRALRPDLALRAHPLDRPLIESWERIAAERYGWYDRHGIGYDEETWAWLRDAAGADTALDGTVADGERIDLGGIELEVLHLPGHSLGHLGLFEPAGRTAIVSDAVMGYGFNDRRGGRAGPPPYVDLDAYRATIERIRDLGAARLGTAHFPLMEGEEIGDFLDLRRRFTDDLERAIEETGGSAMPMPELLATAAAELGGYPEMEVELARSIGAHLERQAP
jgi:glyoxylase-like metal-dependent hydrolase (beta-lactamase superfamily II)